MFGDFFAAFENFDLRDGDCRVESHNDIDEEADVHHQVYIERLVVFFVLIVVDTQVEWHSQATRHQTDPANQVPKLLHKVMRVEKTPFSTVRLVC